MKGLRARINVPILVLCCLVGVPAGMGIATFQYAEGTAYLSNDPKACVNCHIMRDQYDSWQKSSHHVVATCNDCHTPHGLIPKYLAKAENGFWHSKGFTLQDFHEPIRIRPKNVRVLNENCVYCHDEMVSEIAPAHGLGHLKNKEAELGAHGGSMNCTHCHASVGHGPQR